MQNETVLIVDDGRDNREFLVDYVLKPNGFTCLQAADGLEGLNMALEHHPDLILLDFQMPRLNGKQVLERMQEENLDIPVILMTLHGSEEVAIEVYRLGVRDYVKKPYYPEEMLAAVDKALMQTRLRREKEALTERVLAANRELQRRVGELNTLYRVGKTVTSVVDVNQLLPRLLDSIVGITNTEEAFIALLEGRQMVRRAYYTQLMKQSRAVEEPTEDAIAKQVFKTRQHMLLAGDQIPAQSGVKSPSALLYMPILMHDKPVGIIGVQSFTLNAPPFTPNDAALLSALSDYIAIAIENARNSALASSGEHTASAASAVVHPTAGTASSAPMIPANRQEIGVLVAEIRGYGAWSESVAPDVVVQTLNRYMNTIATIVAQREGSVEKLMGDGLVAIFNAPNQQSDYVRRMAASALEMVGAVETAAAEQGIQIMLSVGITVGNAVVGVIGNDTDWSFSAVGDPVTLARRLTEVAQPSQVLTDSSVIDRLGKRIKIRALGELKVKGRKAPLSAFELQEI